jgi:hypothetical protein
MYDLPQAGIIAQELLEQCLLKAGSTKSKITPGYWKHEWRPISFTLVVDNFGVKYIGKEHVLHLIKVLKEHYEVEEDWGGTRYLGITLDWDYKCNKVHLPMPEYIEQALAHFGHPIPDKPQHQPHPHTILTYGATVQYAKPEDTSRPLSPAEKKFIQEVIGIFLYYGRVVNSTMLTTLSAIAATQTGLTKDTMTQCKQFLDYAATHQDAIITYRRSDMVLVMHSNASYLSEPKACSRAGGQKNPPTPPTLKTMAWSSTLPNSSRLSCPLLPKLNWVHCISMPIRPSPNNTHSKKWDTSNPQHLYKPTIAWC